jgi:NADH-quinone oxidoreductase subunit N
MTVNDLLSILPLAVLLAWAMLLILVDLWIPAGRKGWTALLAALGLAVSLGLALAQAHQSMTAFNGMVVVDGFAAFLNVVFLASGMVGVALAYDYLQRTGIERGEYYALLLFSVSGMLLMAYAADLIVVFLALELLSIPLYVLTGFARLQADSEEASLKYFLLGTFASAFVLYGVAMLYGATAHTGIGDILSAVRAGTANPALLLAGAALLLIGFGFKVAAVPFHMWTPDVYQGAPSSVTGFMAIGAKAAGFTALLRIFVTLFPGLATQIAPLAWVLSALTMAVGNVLAITQTNIKRMLAYSSIANAGYMLMAFVSYGQKQASADAVASALFYLVAYGLTNLGAWAVVIAVEQAEGRGLELKDYAGLGRKYPLLAASMLVFMLSFTGVPPLVGFWGKFYLFRTAIEGGYTGLALIGLVTSVISAYYYLRVVVIMYMRSGEPEAVPDPWLRTTAIVSAAAVVLLALVPGPLIQLAATALMRLQ